jgi:hypothetical protein
MDRCRGNRKQGVRMRPGGDRRESEGPRAAGWLPGRDACGPDLGGLQGNGQRQCHTPGPLGGPARCSREETQERRPCGWRSSCREAATRTRELKDPNCEIPFGLRERGQTRITRKAAEVHSRILEIDLQDV